MDLSHVANVAKTKAAVCKMHVLFNFASTELELMVGYMRVNVWFEQVFNPLWMIGRPEVRLDLRKFSHMKLLQQFLQTKA